jgi:DNA-binding CsgD family transcriptional regulator
MKELSVSDLLNLGFTKAEARVVQVLLTGVSNKEIARCLFAKEKTVKFHLTNCYRKMGVKSRSELMSRFMDPKPKENIDRSMLPVGIRA